MLASVWSTMATWSASLDVRLRAWIPADSTSVLYYVPILAWVMAYFRQSFKSPLPWEGDSQTFYMESVIRNGERTAGSISGGSVQSYTDYAGTGMVGETVGWCAFIWFLVWLCIWRGIGMTGRVVYFTMGFPIVMVIVLVGRGVSLPNAGSGIRYAWATWRSDALAEGQIWQDACGQIFFSIGLGMGYFTTYASYNNQFQNAVQDALIICCSNSLIEILCGLAVFGVIGYLGMDPAAAAEAGERIGSFDIAFLTLPEGTAQMPGAQFWSAIFFLTLMILGVSSAFALLDTVISLICDSNFGRRWNRSIVVTVVTIVSFLISLVFCTEFGYYLLDGFDTWLNNFSLVWVVMCEFLGATVIYRYKDVVGLLGWNAYGTWTASYLLSLILGVAIGHSVSPWVGAVVGFLVFFIGLAVAVVLARSPHNATQGPPAFWSKQVFLEKLYYLTIYQVSITIPALHPIPLTSHPGLPTLPRPQPRRRLRQKLEDPHLLGPSVALHLSPHPRHHPQLLLPFVQRQPPRPVPHHRLRRRQYDHALCGPWLGFAQVLRPLRSD